MKGLRLRLAGALVCLLAAICIICSCGGGGGSTTPPPPPPPPTPTAVAPSFSPAAGTYSSAQTVTLSTTTPGATIYYTTDGSTPTSASTRYAEAITVSTTTTIKAIATASGYLDSSVVSASYTISIPNPAATPVFSPAQGNFSLSGPLTVTISNTTSGAAIYYTTDGSTPTASSTRYTGALSLSATTTVKAIAIAPGYLDSSVATATYNITVAPPPSYTWNNAQVVAGGFITGIVPHPTQPGLMYLRTDIGGAYRWDATAKQWIPLTDWIGFANSNYLGIEAIGVDPSDPQRLYLAGGTYTQSWAGNGAMLVSSDQGNTFNVVPMPFKMGANEDGRSSGERFGVDPNKGSTIYFGSRKNGLWRSTDYGTTWNQVTSFPVTGVTSGAGIVFVDFVKSSGTAGSLTPVIYIGVSDTGTGANYQGLYRSVDAGQTWTAVPGQPIGLYPNHGVFGPDGSLYISYGSGIGPNGMTSGAIWKYTPDASTPSANGSWKNITPPAPSYPNNGSYGYGIVAANPAGNIMVSTMDLWWQHDNLYRSTDGGTTWKSVVDGGATYDTTASPYMAQMQQPPSPGWWIGALALDPFDPDHVLYGTGATVWATHNARQTDSGQSTAWTTAEALGIEETAVLKLLSPPSGPANLVSGLGDVCGFAHLDLTVSPAAGKFANPDCGDTTGLDYGVTTYTAVDAWGDSLTYSNYPSQLSALIGLPVSNQGVSGQTSTQVLTRFLAATDKHSDTAIIWAGHNNQFTPDVVLSDIGSMVAAITPPKRFFVLSLLTGGYTDHWKGGSAYNNITRINSALAAAYPGHYIDVRRVLVESYDPNNPQDVIDHEHDTVPSSLRVDNIHLTPAGYQIVAQTVANAMATPMMMARVGTGGNGPFGGYSTDGGVTWTQFGSKPATTQGGGTIAVSADGKTFVWAPSDTSSLYYSTDNGTTWTASTGAAAQKPVLSDRINPSKFYVFDSSTGTLYSSNNGGVSFTAANSALPHSGTLAVSYTAEGDLWLATDSGLYHSTDSGTNFTQLSSVQQGYGIGFGKAATGTAYPAIYLAGEIGGTQALFRSTDSGLSWVRISDDQHQYGWISVITGDPRVFGRVYIGANGRGIVYGDSAN